MGTGWAQFPTEDEMHAKAHVERPFGIKDEYVICPLKRDNVTIGKAKVWRDGRVDLTIDASDHGRYVWDALLLDHAQSVSLPPRAPGPDLIPAKPRFVEGDQNASD